MNITTTENSIIINDGEKNLYFSKIQDGWVYLYRIFFNFFKEIIGNYMIENLFLYDNTKVEPKEFVKEKKYRFNSDSAKDEYVEFTYQYHHSITITIKINDLNKYRHNNRINLYYDCSLRSGFNVSFENLFNNLKTFVKEKEELKPLQEGVKNKPSFFNFLFFFFLISYNISIKR